MLAMSVPTTASFRDRPIPSWYDDAKLGIFVHWGIYSVPAGAPKPVSTEDPDQASLPSFEMNPYAEWYQNTLGIEGSPTRRHHAETYGADFPYRRFAEEFNREIATWKPDAWAELFASAGARYAVLTTKHHDGFRSGRASTATRRLPTSSLRATWWESSPTPFAAEGFGWVSTTRVASTGSPTTR